MIDVRVNWFDEIDSTNSQAHRCRHEASDFTVWAAEFQTAGRGQRGNTWESAVGENLTFSILLKPSNFLSTRQFELSQVVALGVVDNKANIGFVDTHTKSVGGNHNADFVINPLILSYCTFGVW